MKVVGQNESGWWAACGLPDCRWLETGFANERTAHLIRERHIGYVCAVPKCHHP